MHHDRRSPLHQPGVDPRYRGPASAHLRQEEIGGVYGPAAEAGPPGTARFRKTNPTPRGTPDGSLRTTTQFRQTNPIRGPAGGRWSTPRIPSRSIPVEAIGRTRSAKRTSGEISERTQTSVYAAFRCSIAGKPRIVSPIAPGRMISRRLPEPVESPGIVPQHHPRQFGRPVPR